MRVVLPVSSSAAHRSQCSSRPAPVAPPWPRPLDHAHQRRAGGRGDLADSAQYEAAETREREGRGRFT